MLLRIILVLTGIFSLNVYAGVSNDVPVTVDLTSRMAMGNYKTARFSATIPNDGSLIGCGTSVSETETGDVFRTGFCQARTPTGEHAFCSISTPELAKQAGSISDYSFVRFFWDENGICTRISVSTQSFYIPDGVE